MHLNVPTDNEKRSDPECLPESSIGGALRSSPTTSPSKIRPSGPSRTPACYFCRARKIVCHRQNPDSPCNQCLRRSNKCEYPIQRRRGMHKKKVITTGNTS
ncbi:hypothetical protein VKT23_017112 [Stygiomarasmius scandens]|uniref:Zn(2)-C6 fungal-type domain-containing protein n=1 Tax=Marasmiellus scandens TaxID=2682957 RepID=A0ABR1IVQ0_9AGAR